MSHVGALIFFFIFFFFFNAFASDEVPKFNYLEPEKWGSLNPKYEACSKGKRQSPLNINTNEAVITESLKPLTRFYHIYNASLSTDGIDVEIKFQGRGELIIDGKTYKLKQMHWHTPSEHHFNGVQYASELHQVHVADDGSRAVVAILYKYGPPDPVLTMLKPQLEELAKKPCQGDETQVAIPEFESMFLNRRPRKYYRYPGSLTTPPCDENVTWNIVCKGAARRWLFRRQVHSARLYLKMSKNQDNRLPLDLNFDIFDSQLNFTDLLNVQNSYNPPTYNITAAQNQESNPIHLTPIPNDFQEPNTLVWDNIQTREEFFDSQVPNNQLGDNSQPHESATVSGRQENQPSSTNDEGQSNNQRLEAWDSPMDLRTKLPWNRVMRDFDAVTGSGKRGVAASITNILKIKQDHEGSCWSKVTRDTKEFYFGEFKKKYKWDPQIEGDVRTAFMARAAIRYKNLIYTARQEQKQWEAEEHHDRPYCPNWTSSNIWAAWNGYTSTPEFERKSSRGKKNRRKGDLSAEPLGTYHCGSLSAAKVMDDMAKKDGDERPNAYKIFCRTKGVSDGKGNRILVNSDDKKLDVIYNRMVDEHLQAGKALDYNEIYLRAVLELTDRPSPSASVYGIGSASQALYPDLVDPPRVTTDDRSAIERIQERFMRQEEQMADIMRHITAVTDVRVNAQQQHLDLLQQRLASVEHENTRLKNLLSRVSFGNGPGGSSRGGLNSC